MRKPQNRPYLYSMLAGFGAISMSVIFFFIIYRAQGLGAALDKLMGILMPFVYGGVIAYLLRPMCNGYSDTFHKHLPGKFKKLAEPIAITLSMITGLLIVYALIIMIAPQLYESVRTIWNAIPGNVEKTMEWIETVFGENVAMREMFDNLFSATYTTIDGWLTTTLVPYINNMFGGLDNLVSGVGNIVSEVGTTVGKVLVFVKNILIGLIAAIYMLANRKTFKRQGTMLIRGLLKPRWAQLVLDEISFVDRMFGGFIEGKLVDSAIIGVLCYIGCMIFKFPNALLVSAIVGVTNVIPFFGPFLGAIPSILLILIESPIKALWFALFVLFLQQLDGNVIGPKILGDHTGVDSFWVLFSILLFGGLWGLVGMIVAVPLFAVIYDLVRRLVFRGLRKHGCSDILKAYGATAPEEAPSEET